MTQDQQIERWKIFQSQVEVAAKSGSILCLGDMNIYLEKLEDPSYYLKGLAEEYQMTIGENGLETLNFGYTWQRIINNIVVKSAVDHAFTNRPNFIHDFYKIPIDYSDHSMICIDMNINVSRLKKHSTITRDMRKLKSNPQFFLKELSKLDWASFVNMSDVDKMEEEWTKERNNCLNKNN